MKLFALIALMLYAAELHAQHLLIGARSGLANWGDEVISSGENRTDALATEIFLRYETKSSFAFEASLSRERIVKTELFGEHFPSIGLSQPGGSETKHTCYGVNLRAQSGIGFKRIKRLKNFVGLAIMPAVIVSQQQEYFYSAPGKREEFSGSSRRLALQLGIEDMFQYDLSPAFSVQLLLGCRLASAPEQGFGTAATAQIGAAYRL